MWLKPIIARIVAQISDQFEKLDPEIEIIPKAKGVLNKLKLLHLEFSNELKVTNLKLSLHGGFV